jgi:hypothetical protein
MTTTVDESIYVYPFGLCIPVEKPILLLAHSRHVSGVWRRVRVDASKINNETDWCPVNSQSFGRECDMADVQTPLTKLSDRCVLMPTHSGCSSSLLRE